MIFKVGYAFNNIADDALGLIFHKDKLLIDKNTQNPFTALKFIHESMRAASLHYFLGTVDNHPLHTYELEDTNQIDPAFTWVTIKLFLETVDVPLQGLLCRARQILNWHYRNLFCGSCGEKTLISEIELAKICKHCDRIIYPHTSPAVIVLVERGPEILLGRSPHFREGVYSTLAGFIEPGESAEEAIVREIKEEVGISVKNPKYFGSQSWPFLNSFMMGFNVEYASGEISIDPTELEDAKWFTLDSLPPLPYPVTLSRKLIEYFRSRKEGK